MRIDNEVPMDERALRTLDQILAIVRTLKDDMAVLDQRISGIEERIQTDKSRQPVYHVVEIPGASSGQIPRNPEHIITNFEGLEEHLKETYAALSQINRAMTANQLANLRGRKRSTISDHLNQLYKRDLVEKTRHAKEVCYTVKTRNIQKKS